MTGIDHGVDLFGPAMLADPYARYARLRESDPVHWSAALDSWLLTRFADVSAALRDPAFSSVLPTPDPTPDPALHPAPDQSAGPAVPAEVLSNIYTFVQSSLVFSDPPHHTRLRRLVSRAFAPGVVGALSDVTAETTEELLQETTGVQDLITTLAEPLPMLVLGELLGVPLSDADCRHVKVACDDFLLPFGRDPSTLSQDEVTRAHAAGGELNDFVTTVLDRPASRDGDVVGRLLAGEAEDRLTRRELFANIVLLLVAGHENLTSLLGNGAALLFDLPGVRGAVRADPSRWPAVVDELLRLVTPNQFIRRQARRDVTIGDRVIAAGQGVLLVLAAANRGPAQYPDPDVFQLERPDRRDVAMGLGMHYCLGAPLARVGSRIALRTLFDRYPDARRADAELAYVPNFNVRLLQALPVVLQ